ncbi:hypothetical protein BDF22DRAFT_686643 [Syncephalis plumigaleata]|nr:hypothetical protein BDF22DRAFT_686643 [Syncephalis plumigaleata]
MTSDNVIAIKILINFLYSRSIYRLLDNFEPAPPRFSIQRRTLHKYYIQYAERVDPEGELLDLANFGRLVVSTFPGIRSRRLGQRRMST